MSQILGEMNYQKYKSLPFDDLDIDNYNEDCIERMNYDLKERLNDQKYDSKSHRQANSQFVEPGNCSERVDVLYKKDVIREMKLEHKKN